MDIEESTVLQGIDAGRRTAHMKKITDDNDTEEIVGMERQFVDQLFACETQRAYVAELKTALASVAEDIDEEDKASLRKTLSSNASTLVLMEVRFKALEKTLGDIQKRMKAIDIAGTAS